MKKLVIFGSLMAFSAIAGAQVWTTGAGQETTPGKVGIGTSNPGYKLHVVENTGANYAFGILAESYGSGTEVTGIRGEGYGNGSTKTFGGVFTSGGASYHNIGVYGNVLDDNASLNTGMYGDALGFAGAWAGWFQGSVYCTGAYLPSDRNLKKEIRPIANSLSIINRLNPVNYSFDVASNKYLSLPAEKQYGFISQEIRDIMPELTKQVHHPAKLDDKGNEMMPAKDILTLNYNGFIAILTKGIQEQQQTIVSMQDRIAQLEKALSTSQATGINHTSGLDNFAMDQNIPNPFSSETTIKYTLPQQVNSASLLVYDLTGKQIDSFALTEEALRPSPSPPKNYQPASTSILL